MSSLNIRGSRVPLKEFLPDIQAKVVGIDPNLALQMIMNACIKLARETGVIEQVICIPLEACINSYMVDAGEDIIYSLKKVRLLAGDAPICHTTNPEDIAKRTYLDVTSGVVYLDPEPTKAEDGMILEVTLALLPDRRGDTVPEYIYTVWADAVVALTLSDIFRMPDAAWANEKSAETQYRLYKNTVWEIRRNVAMRNRSMNMRLKVAQGLRGKR